VEVLNAFVATADMGEPTFVSLVRQAIDEFIARKMASAETKAQVEAHLKQRKIVTLREVNGKK
jgi:hypothetical protein